MLSGSGGCVDRAADHSSQEVTLIEKGSMGVGLLEDCGTTGWRLSGVEREAVEEAEGIATAIV